MKKRLRHYIPAYGLIALFVGLGFTSGCTFMSSERLLNDIPSSPSVVYMSHSPLPEPASAQDKQVAFPDGQVLTLVQCIQIALAHNPETRESWQHIRSAAAGVGQARSAYLPSSDFTAGADRSNSVSLNNRQDTSSVNTFDAKFGARYLLFDGGERSAGLKSAKADLLEADFQHNSVLQDLALKVKEAYYRLLAAKELEHVAEETVRQTQYHVDLARARHKNGLVARSDMLKAETEKANANLLLVRVRNEVRIARGQLANAMGLNPSKSFDVAKLPQNQYQQELTDINHLIAEASMHRPELRAALARVESKRLKVKAAGARYWPKIMFNTDYGWRDRKFVPEHNEWFFGLSLTWPLFDGLNREYTVRKAKSDLAKSVAEYEKLLRGIELEVWTDYSKFIEAGQAVKAAQALVASAEESARVTEGEYKNGTASIIEVIDTQTARTTANVRLVQARLDWYTAMARLERDIGRILASEKNIALNGENSH